METKVPIKTLPKNSYFKLNNYLKGELLDIYEMGDVKVKVFRSGKTEVMHWSSESMVAPISGEEFNSDCFEKEVVEAKKEREKRRKGEETDVGLVKASHGRDRFGCQIGKIPATINAAIMIGNPLTLGEIGARCPSVPLSRVALHLDWWLARPNEGIGRALATKDGKYWFKS